MVQFFMARLVGGVSPDHGFRGTTEIHERWKALGANVRSARSRWIQRGCRSVDRFFERKRVGVEWQVRIALSPTRLFLV